MNLKIVTWNIFFGKELGRILDVVRTNKEFANVDFFILQEASVHDGIEDAERIASAIGKDYDYFLATAQERKGMVQANAVIWNTKRVTVSNKEVLPLPTFRQAKLGHFEKTIKHISKKEKRNSLIIEGIVDKKTFRLYATHFDVIGFELKTVQLLCLLEDNAKRNTKDFTCIAGDLNTFKIIKHPTWKTLKMLADYHGFTDITTHITWTFHKRAFHYFQKTDSIFIKKSDTISYSSESRNFPGSDHIPIFADISIR